MLKENTDRIMTCHILVMSPDRFWCHGLLSLVQSLAPTGYTIQCCHSLQSLRAMAEPSDCAVILTEEYGEGENIGDWLEFSYWLYREYPGTEVVILYRTDGTGTMAIPSRIDRPGVMNASATISEMKWFLAQARQGNVRGCTGLYRGETLTVRERYILRCLCHGESPAVVGARLGIQVKTVSSFKSTALRKLGVTRISPLLGRYHGLFPREHQCAVRHNNNDG